MENADGTPATDGAPEDEEPKDDRSVIYYVTDLNQQGQYIKMFKEQDMNAVILNHNIDTSFISQLERRNEKYKFMRIDADLTESLKEESNEEELKAATETLTELFHKALGNDKLKVKAEKLKDSNISSILTLSEEGRRMQDMMKMYSMGGAGMDASMFGADQTLTLNTGHELVSYLLEHKDSEHISFTISPGSATSRLRLRRWQSLSRGAIRSCCCWQTKTRLQKNTRPIEGGHFIL